MAGRARRFAWSQSIAAGATFNPLATWDYETPRVPMLLEIFHRATLVGLLSTLKSGGDTIEQESPVPAGGTAGVPPGRLDVDPITGEATALLKTALVYRNPTAGAIVVDGYVNAVEMGGGGGGGGGGGFRRRGRGRR